MSSRTSYKPRYKLAHITKNKVWPYKEAYLRRFHEFRARRVCRWGLFRRCVLVATTMKWKKARRFIRPDARRKRRVAGSAGITAYGKPRKRHYRTTFNSILQLRYFHGKRKTETFRQIYRSSRTLVGKPSTSYFSVLESRLDRVFFRRRLLPTIYACHQYIQHRGLSVNGSIEKSPNSLVRVGDIVEIPRSTWRSFFWDLFCRVYYRRWGLFVTRRRLYSQIKKKLFSVRGHRFRRTTFKRTFNTSVFSSKANIANKSNYANYANMFSFLSNKKSNITKKNKFKYKTALFKKKYKRVNQPYQPSLVKRFYTRFNTVNPSFFKFRVFRVNSKFNLSNKFKLFRRNKRKLANKLKQLRRNKRKLPNKFSLPNKLKQLRLNERNLPNKLKRLNKLNRSYKLKRRNKLNKLKRFRRNKGLFFSKKYAFVGRGAVSFPDGFKDFLRNFSAFIDSAYSANVSDTDSSFTARVIESSLKNEDKRFLNVNEYSSELPSVLIRSKKNIKKQPGQLQLKGLKGKGLKGLFYKQQQVKNRLAYSFFFRKELYNANKNSGFEDFEDYVDYSNIFTKFQQFHKLILSRRLSKSLHTTIRPRKTPRRFRRFGYKVKAAPKRWHYRRALSRSRFRRYKRRLKRKSKRQRKYIRQKPVHFFIPAYLQMDFRTLRAVKVKSPSFIDIYHPFRTSFAKRRSFYKARGL